MCMFSSLYGIYVKVVYFNVYIYIRYSTDLDSRSVLLYRVGPLVFFSIWRWKFPLGWFAVNGEAFSQGDKVHGEKHYSPRPYVNHAFGRCVWVGSRVYIPELDLMLGQWVLFEIVQHTLKAFRYKYSGRGGDIANPGHYLNVLAAPVETVVTASELAFHLDNAFAKSDHCHFSLLQISMLRRK